MRRTWHRRYSRNVSGTGVVIFPGMARRQVMRLTFARNVRVSTATDKAEVPERRKEAACVPGNDLALNSGDLN